MDRASRDPDSSLPLYGGSLALLTDLYQLTMAYGYWRSERLRGMEAAYNLFYRRNPFQGGYTVACGLGYVFDFLDRFRFDDGDLAYLADVRGNDGEPLFPSPFLEFLRELRFSCDIDAVPEGTVVFPAEPLVRVTGPVVECQLLETPLLNMINFQTLIATKAARVCEAARGRPVVEFGLRRAHGFDGGLAASRAAFVGGCESTSNVLAGKLFGIPPRGTHAHSWIMVFDHELEAFEEYAEALPNNCIFLVDTYDSLNGVRNACRVGRQLRQRGHEMVGIRLDSGDLAYLSTEARKILDAEGFPEAKIFASNDLDEYIIGSLLEQHAPIGVWGVGTRLVTAYDQPSLGGVYKVVAVRHEGAEWKYRLKLSEQSIKISNPGLQQVRRYRGEQFFVADAIYDLQDPPGDSCIIVDPLDPTRHKKVEAGTEWEDLLVPVYRGGKRVYESPSLAESRERTRRQIDHLHPGIRRFLHPHEYPVGLEKGLHETKMRLVLRARQS